MATAKIAITAGLLGLAFATPAVAAVNNTTFANFGQTASNPLFNYNSVGNTNTVLSASTTSPFFQNGLQSEQTGFNDSISFTGKEPGFVGVDFLTVTFWDATFSFDGDGSSGSLISSDPSSPIFYISDVINTAGFSSRDFGFNVTGSTSGFMVTDSGMGAPFVANLNGAFAGTGIGTGAVPEPASWAMLISGFVALQGRQLVVASAT